MGTIIEIITPIGPETIKNRTLRFSLLLCLLSIVLSSCDQAMVYDQWSKTNDNVWHEDSLCRFDVNISDTISPVDFILGVRNDNSYSYSNLWMFIQIEAPTGITVKDTFEVELASPYGKWHGSGWGNIYTSSHYYSKAYVFPHSGRYTFTFQQGMRKQELEGIKAIGLRIEKEKQYVK